MIFAYWRYTDFSRTMLAERGELYMEQNLPPLPPIIFENGLYYELRGEQYYPCLLPPEPDTTEDKLLETIIRQMAEAQGINEDLKARDQMAWVGAMNNIKAPRLRSCESPNNAPRRKQKQKINASGDRSNACLRYFYAPMGKEEQYGLFLRA